MDQCEIPDDRFDLAPLELPDEVPLHSLVRTESGHFFNSLLQPALSEDPNAGFESRFHRPDRHSLRYGNEPNAPGIPPDPARRFRDPGSNGSKGQRQERRIHIQ
jgi:hypothetical protein